MISFATSVVPAELILDSDKTFKGSSSTAISIHRSLGTYRSPKETGGVGECGIGADARIASMWFDVKRASRLVDWSIFEVVRKQAPRHAVHNTSGV